MGYIYALPIIALLSIFLGSLGLLLANSIKQLENFAGVMNFVIFPMFFLSSALYPLWKMQEASEWLYQVCAFNPFTSGVELLRFGLYEKLAAKELVIVLVLTLITFTFAVRSFRPKPAASFSINSAGNKGAGNKETGNKGIGNKGIGNKSDGKKQRIKANQQGRP